MLGYRVDVRTLVSLENNLDSRYLVKLNDMYVFCLDPVVIVYDGSPAIITIYIVASGHSSTNGELFRAYALKSHSYIIDTVI